MSPPIPCEECWSLFLLWKSAAYHDGLRRGSEENEAFQQEGHRGVPRRYPHQTWPDYLPRCSGQRAAFCFLLSVFQTALGRVGLLIGGCHIMSRGHAQSSISCSVVIDPEGVLWGFLSEAGGSAGRQKPAGGLGQNFSAGVIQSSVCFPGR